MLSAEDAGIYKPHREIYHWSAIRLGIRPEAGMMVSSHGWDVGGAAWAGMRSAFVARKGQVLYPLAPSPEIMGTDIEEIAHRLIYTTNSKKNKAMTDNYFLFHHGSKKGGTF